MNTITKTFAEIAMELAKQRTDASDQKRREVQEIKDKEVQRRRAIIAPLLEVLKDAKANLSSKLYVFDLHTPAPYFCSTEKYYIANSRRISVEVRENDTVRIVSRDREASPFEEPKVEAERPADRVIELVPILLSFIADAIRPRDYHG